MQIEYLLLSLFSKPTVRLLIRNSLDSIEMAEHSKVTCSLHFTPHRFCVTQSVTKPDFYILSIVHFVDYHLFTINMFSTHVSWVVWKTERNRSHWSMHSPLAQRERKSKSLETWGTWLHLRTYIDFYQYPR